jgi:hypothetical protein
MAFGQFRTLGLRKSARICQTVTFALCSLYIIRGSSRDYGRITQASLVRVRIPLGRFPCNSASAAFCFFP